MEIKLVFFLCCTVILKTSQASQARYFIVEGRNTSMIRELTTEIYVNGSYRYPCYISVSVYTDPTLTKPFANASVNAITSERNDNHVYIGYSTTKTDSNGHACLLSLCYKSAIITVEVGENSTLERLYFQNNSKTIPSGYTYKTTSSTSEELKFDVSNWGVVDGRTGPVYSLYEHNTCEKANDANFHFSFSFIAKKEELNTPMAVDEHFKDTSWYYSNPYLIEHQVCYLKVKVKIPTYQSELTLESRNADNGMLYGTFVAGPKASPLAQDQNTKAACMEFRCAVRKGDNTKSSTTVTGYFNFLPGASAKSCTMSVAPKVKAVVQTNSTSFSMTMRSDDNYGADSGIYKDHDKNTAKSMCYTGQTGNIANYEMNPDTNYLIFYDCMQNSPPVVGK